MAVNVAMAMASLAPSGTSNRMKALQQAKVTEEEREQLLRDMITRRCTSPGTILQRIRYLERVRRLAEAKGWDFWTMTEVQLCLAIKQAGAGGNTVPEAIHAALVWFEGILQLGWPMKDELVLAAAQTSKKEARKEQEQAKPYDQAAVDKLLDYYFKVSGDHEAAAYAAGFLLLLTFACLRFSDAHRSKDIGLNEDSLHGKTWRSKSKKEGMAWAALRTTWDGRDWAKPFADLANRILPPEPRAWLWPKMYISHGSLALVEPIQKGSYNNALATMAWVHKDMGGGTRTSHSTVLGSSSRP